MRPRLSSPYSSGRAPCTRVPDFGAPRRRGRHDDARPRYRGSTTLPPATRPWCSGCATSPTSPSPTASQWCDGSEQEWQRLTSELVESGTFLKLDETKRPNSFYCRLRPERRRPRRGPHLHLQRGGGRRRPDEQLDGARRDAGDARAAVRRLHARPHHVRRPVLHGPARLADLASSASRSPTAPTSSTSMRIMTRMGTPALEEIGDDGFFVPAVHTVGAPLDRRSGRRRRGRATTRSTSSTTPRPARSGPTAPATAATRCSARSASRCASRRSWRATRAGWPSTCSSSSSRRRAASRATSPPRSRAPAARPTSRCCSRRSTGWKVETVGDDIAWMRFGDDGRLYAINPEAGFFGVAPGTGEDTNANAVKTFYGNTHLHQRRAAPTTATSGGRA